MEVKRPEQLEVILTLSDLFLPELTWSATPSSLYCVSWSMAFIEVGATTAIELVASFVNFPNVL